MESIRLKFSDIPKLASMSARDLTYLTREEVNFLCDEQNFPSGILKWSMAIGMKKALENANCGFPISSSDERDSCIELGFKVVNDAAFHPSLFHAERYVYKDLFARINQGGIATVSLDFINLDRKQADVAQSIINSYVTFLIGGPGTGKSTCIKKIVGEFLNQRISGSAEIAILCATNSACNGYRDLNCKVLTVHKALEFNPISMDFKKNRENPFVADYVFIEESGLLDIVTIHALLSALPHQTKIVFVGDKNQLGSTGPGDFLSDSVALKCFSVVELSENYRSNKFIQSLVNSVKEREALNQAPDGVYFIKGPNSSVEYYEKFLKILFKLEESGIDTINALQILAPKYKGIGGINEINSLLHNVLTENESGVFGVGDKVLLVSGSASIPSTELGVITDTSKSSALIKVSGVDGVRSLNVNKSSGIELAFALSIHKSQGGEFENGIICLWKSDLEWLGFRGVYTAISRFKRTVTFYGDVELADLYSLKNQPRITLGSASGFNVAALLKLI